MKSRVRDGQTSRKQTIDRWGWAAACLPGFPGDLARVVRVHDGRWVHRAALAASPGSAAAVGEEREEGDEEEPRREGRRAVPCPWRTRRHCNGEIPHSPTCSS